MEFFNSFFKSINERLTSPLYGALLIATIIWNYDIILTIFFVDNESILAVTHNTYIKSVYIHDILFPTVLGENLFHYYNPIFAYLIAWFWRLFPVVILAYLFIAKLPILANKAHKTERDFMLERDKGNIEYERAIALEKAKLLKAEKKQIDAERGKVTSEKRKRTAIKNLGTIIDGDIIPQKRTEQELWDEDYQLLTTKYQNLLNELSTFIFQLNGYASERGYSNTNYIQIFEVNDLIKKVKDSRNYYELTEKGKYLLKKKTLA